MGKAGLPRRRFLGLASSLGITTVLGGLLKLIPEADTAWAKGEDRINAFLQTPEDLVITQLQDSEASKAITQALRNKGVMALRRKLPSFRAIIDEARVVSEAWSNGAQQAIVIAIPFKNPQGKVAVLQHVVMNGIPQSAIVEFTDMANMTSGRLYTLAEENVQTMDLTPTSMGTMAAGCTTDCLIQCLPLWGCSGLALTLCIAAILSCPFFVGSCVAAWACTLYCGGAFSKCWCWCCGC